MGYTGGDHPDPTYHDLGDHTEALQIDFDPEVIDYATLVEQFWRAHDPTRPAWSTQYRAALWTSGDDQAAIALALAEDVAGDRGPIRTAIEPAKRFYRAEDYHQKYRLRREKEVVMSLVDRYGSDRAMVDSTTAARLNGLLRGFGGRRDLQRLLPLMDLPRDAERRLLARVNG